VLWCFYCISA